MSKIAITGAATGTATFTIESPATSTNRTLTIPDATTTIVGTDATQTLTNKTLTTPNIDSAQVDTVSGTAPLYFTRAWVNFNGTGTVAIRASGNVSSITDNGTGTYVVKLTVSMSDSNSAAVGSAIPGTAASNNSNRIVFCAPISVSEIRVNITSDSGGFNDSEFVNVAVFR